ncbi:LOW QUALITY PROTEIN: hypothetical protein V2J09_001159 [Rumex salicifolius]
MTNLGSLYYFLGVVATRNHNEIFLSQEKYAIEILEKAGMTNYKPSTTRRPCRQTDQTDNLFPNLTLYRSLARVSQYLTFTRPDIQYVVQQVCLYMHEPRESHFNAPKCIFRYIKGTTNFSLLISQLTAYTDVDWARCPDIRRNTSGYYVYLSDNLIFWSSKQQTQVSRSSAEAEYRAIANTMVETSWLKQLLQELHVCPTKTTLIFCDNIITVYMSSNPVQHRRSKHVEIDLHLVRDKVRLGEIRVLHVPSTNQYADIFIKGLPTVLFNDLRSSLHIQAPHVQIAGDIR